MYQDLSPYINVKTPISRLFLWGMPGVGKSTCGSKLAKKLGWTFIDLDHEVEKDAGQSVADIFSASGETGFREKEKQTLQNVLVRNHCVVATGGGTPCFEDNGERMHTAGLCVWLDAPVGRLAHRIFNAKTKRPLLSFRSHEELTAALHLLLEKRNDCYGLAHMIISTDQLTSEELLNLLAQIIQDKS